MPPFFSVVRMPAGLGDLTASIGYKTPMENDLKSTTPFNGGTLSTFEDGVRELRLKQIEDDAITTQLAESL